MKKSLFAAALFAFAVAGTAYADSKFAVSVSAPSAKVSAKATAVVKVVPQGDFHMNPDYPARLTLTAPDGVTLDKEKITAKEAKRLDKDGLEMSVAFTAASAGKKSIAGELKFAVCKESECSPQTVKVSIDVDVK